MVLGVSTDMSESEKEVVTGLMVDGFDKTAREAQTRVVGGQTVYNPWPMIGGAGIACFNTESIIFPYNLKSGDVMILTKPLGTQMAVNAF